MLVLALATPFVLLGMLLGMHAVERRLEADDRVPLLAAPPAVLELPVARELPSQRDGIEPERRAAGRSLTA